MNKVEKTPEEQRREDDSKFATRVGLTLKKVIRLLDEECKHKSKDVYMDALMHNVICSNLFRRGISDYVKLNRSTDEADATKTEYERKIADSIMNMLNDVFNSINLDLEVKSKSVIVIPKGEKL